MELLVGQVAYETTALLLFGLVQKKMAGTLEFGLVFPVTLNVDIAAFPGMAAFLELVVLKEGTMVLSDLIVMKVDMGTLLGAVVLKEGRIYLIGPVWLEIGRVRWVGSGDLRRIDHVAFDMGLALLPGQVEVVGMTLCSGLREFEASCSRTTVAKIGTLNLHFGW